MGVFWAGEGGVEEINTPEARPAVDSLMILSRWGRSVTRPDCSSLASASGSANWPGG
jgi:hypothetical protein